jgi:hypothetical protein
VESGQACLVGGGNVGRRLDAFVGGDGVGANVAAANLVDGIRGLIDDEIDLAREPDITPCPKSVPSRRAQQAGL